MNEVIALIPQGLLQEEIAAVAPWYFGRLVPAFTVKWQAAVFPSFVSV